MKEFTKILCLSFCTLMLFGCSAKSKEMPKESSIPETTMSADESYIPENVPLPVMSIVTKSDAPDVMDFVTEPVAKHVGEQIKNEYDPSFDAPVPYYEDCSITLKGSDGSTLMDSADAQVKVRGNWTTVYPKKPLRIKFAEKQGMLGLNDSAEFKNWLLLAEYKDCSMLRNKAVLYAARQIFGADGLYAADADFVQVEINGEYMGLYLLTEMQQAVNSRVDISKTEKEYTGTDIGYFLEYDGYFDNEDDLHKFHMDFADNAPLVPFDGNGGSGKEIRCLNNTNGGYGKEIGFSIKSDINSQQQHDFIADYVNNVYRIMYEAAYNDKAFVFDKDNRTISENSEISPQEAVENVVDVESLADMYIISEFACDADVTWSSVYMDIDFSADHRKKLTFEAPWDFDSSMGNRPRCEDGQGFYASNIVPDPALGLDTINPWLAVLAYEDWYQDIVREKWTEAYDSGVFSRVCQMIESDKETLTDEFKKNYKKWRNDKLKFDFEQELSDEERSCMSEKQSAEHLLEWTKNRIAFLDSQWHLNEK